MFKTRTAKSNFGVKRSGFGHSPKSGDPSRKLGNGGPFRSPASGGYKGNLQSASFRSKPQEKSFNRNSGTNNFGPRKFRPARSSGGGRSSRRPQGENIDISKFIRREVSTASVEQYVATNTFSDFGFCPELQINLDKKEFSAPTSIQDQSIKPIMAGRDLIGLANTGTGKTAVFLLPLIEKVFKNRNEKVLIIAPTRELAIQIDNEFKAYSASMRLFSAICVGGTPIGKQIFTLKRNPNFVIGTPGRLKDLSERGHVRFSSFQNIVLDEVDRMLDMGFINEITDILNALPEKRQALFFSATLPLKIKTLIKQFLADPVTIEVKTGDTAANILQDVVRVNDKTQKFDTLVGLLEKSELTKVLIFSETKWDVEKLAIKLTENGHKAESIHGNKRQNQREKSLAAFRNNNCSILVATDVAARGLDIGDISHVINYTLPQTYNDYVHRIGRTGRGSKSGQALTFIG